MNRSEGIPSIQYMSLISLGLCVILRTNTLKMVLVTVVAVVMTLFIWMPIRYVVKHAHPLAATFASVFFSLAIGLAMIVSIDRFASFIQYSPTSLEYVYLLLLVPMMVAQSHASKKQKLTSEMAIVGGFILIMLFFGVLRELFGLNSIYSIDLSQRFSLKIWMLLHPAGVAFILTVGLSLIIFLYRKYKNEHFQLVLEPQSQLYRALPRFRIQSEMNVWKGVVAFGFISILVGVITAGINRWMIIPDPFKDAIILLSFIAQVTLTGFVYIFSKGLRHLFVEWKITSFVIPFQTLIVVFPLYYAPLSDAKQEFKLSYVLAYSVFVTMAALFVVVLLLFIRAIKQKLLFGRRPNSFEGVPLFFGLTGMILVILYGFEPAVRHIFTIISSLGSI